MRWTSMFLLFVLVAQGETPWQIKKTRSEDLVNRTLEERRANQKINNIKGRARREIERTDRTEKTREEQRREEKRRDEQSER